MRKFLKQFFGDKKYDETAKKKMPQPVEKLPPKEKPLTYLKVSFATDKGKVRENNQDNFFIDGKYSHTYGKNENDSYIELTQGTHVYGLFDGMGGEAFGETASALAAKQLARMADSIRSASSSDLPFYMNEFTRAANSAICDMLDDRSSARGGSTFTALCIKDGTAYPFYLGDSRIYLLDDNGLLQITEDQTLAVRNIKAGVYTEEEAKDSPDHHKLTCYLGADYADMGLDAQPCMPVPLSDGVTMLMCSDGLSDMCSREEIEDILRHEHHHPAQLLVEHALNNGGHDNVTCIVLQTATELV